MLLFVKQRRIILKAKGGIFMKKKQIVFTGYKTAEYLEQPLGELKAGHCLIRTEYTLLSGGTERFNIMKTDPKEYPSYLGYCGVGRIEAVGEGVKGFAEGDRVIIYHGHHTNRQIVRYQDLTKVPEDVDPLDAVFVVIAAMGLGGMRRLQLEVGESAMVVGLGLLGLFSIQFCRLAGACPVIAVDPDPKRRALALEMGADKAIDPSELANMDRVIDGCVEVTGYASALKQLLPVMKRFGRVSLLGCTRVSDEIIDYYFQVHKPGIQLLGAHNMARPSVDSRPGCWTHQDDCKSILKMMSAKRFSMAPMLGRVVKPQDCGEIYRQLCDDRDFPVGTVFDWRDEE